MIGKVAPAGGWFGRLWRMCAVAVDAVGPVWTDLGHVFSASDTALPSVYWPWLVDTEQAGGSFPHRYRCYYSTDHDPGAGGIAYAEADQVAGPWTHRPVVYVDTVLGQQTETPAVMYVPATGLWHLYYQQQNVEAGQRSMLATSTNGVAWTRQGVALSIPANSLQWVGAQIHTGYMVPTRLPGGRWMAYHLLAGGDHPHFGQSWSDDGIAWRTDPRPLGYGLHQTHGLGGRRVEWDTGYLVQTTAGPWWVGTLSNWTSGPAIRDCLIAQAPLSPALRSLAATPVPVLGSGNIRAVNVTTDGDGATWLLYQNGPDIGLAVAA
jgi:hypothetical protein